MTPAVLQALAVVRARMVQEAAQRRSQGDYYEQCMIEEDQALTIINNGIKKFDEEIKASGIALPEVEIPKEKPNTK